MKTGTQSTKGLVLARLRALGGSGVSGVALAAELGLSRVAVWKAVAALKEAGYAVAADGEGYRLDSASSEDFLYPWEFGAHEDLIRYYEETGSTMDRARESADKGAAPGTVVVAGRQSAGRGRAGRQWESDAGGLFFSIVAGGGGSVFSYPLIALRAQLATAAAVTRTTKACAKPRWPNDVYVGGKKIAGLLVEFEAEGDLIRRMIVGVGVNVNNRLTGDRFVSCAELAGRKASRRELLNAFLEAFSAEESPERKASLIERWNAEAFGVGRRAYRIDAAHGLQGAETRPNGQAGVFRGIDGWGRAVLETDEGLVFLEPGISSLRFIDNLL